MNTRNVLALFASAALATSILAACESTTGGGGSAAALDTSGGNKDGFSVGDTGSKDAGGSSDGDTPKSDAGSKDIPSGGEMTLSEIQNKEASKSCAEGTKFVNLVNGVTVKDLVATTGIAKQSAALDGVYAQSAEGPWNAILVTFGTAAYTINQGDKFTVIGDAKDYYCMTELDATTLTVEGTGTPADTKITTAQVGEKGTDNESFESVLVTIENVVVSDQKPLGTDGFTHGSFMVGASETDKALLVAPGWQTTFSQKDETTGKYVAKYTAGTAFKSITGVVQYSYGHYQVVPRSDADLVQ